MIYFGCFVLHEVMTLAYAIRTADSQADTLADWTCVFLVQNDLAAQLTDSPRPAKPGA